MTKTCDKKAKWLIFNEGNAIADHSCDDHLSKMITSIHPRLERVQVRNDYVCDYAAPPKPMTIGCDLAVLASAGGIQILYGALTESPGVLFLDWDACINLRAFIERQISLYPQGE